MGRRKSLTGVQSLDTVRDGDRTFAFGVYYDPEMGRVPFAGLAEKDPNDKENAVRGRSFAKGRAFENLGKTMQKEEWKELKPARKVKPITRKKFTKKEIATLREIARVNDPKVAERLAKREGNVEASEPENKEAPEISKATGKPKRKYTRKPKVSESGTEV